MLSPSLLIALSITVGLLLFQLLQYYHHKKNYYQKILAISAVGLTASVTIWWLIGQMFPADQIPLEAVLWLWPLTECLALVVFFVRDKFGMKLIIPAILMSLVLAGVAANNYYRIFPTLTAVSSLFNRQAIDKYSKPNVPKSDNRVVLEQYFKPLDGQSEKGSLLELAIPASNNNYQPRIGYLYLPPALSNNPQLKLPVIILLHGQPGSPADWRNNNIAGLMDDFAAKHKGLAPIVAMVDVTGTHDQDTECVDSPLGAVETYLTHDVPAYLKQHTQVSTDPNQWAIGGYSMGGTCGNIVALRNPQIYGNFMNISGEVDPSHGDKHSQTLKVLFNDSVDNLAAHSPSRILESHSTFPYPMKAWFFIGADEPKSMINEMQQHYELSKRVGITTQMVTKPGGHTFEVWHEGYIEGLRWLSNQMGLTLYE